MKDENVDMNKQKSMYGIIDVMHYVIGKGFAESAAIVMDGRISEGIF